MASGSVWGIDIGQCALKALRCRAHEDPKKLIAEAFDYIEYPKILSQPGSDPVELIGDALKQFLSRNSVVGDRVAISVAGQTGLARFIKLPPVETKKIPDIVRYEARQQIPFDLNDVVWDYQRMGLGSVEEGFSLDTEVGLFAMKRDAVFRALSPFLKLDIDVDIVQLAPLVLYNFMLFDQLDNVPPPEEYDSENPPESTAIIAMGTDATDLVVTNGYRVWQRPIPLGGTHFTKALVSELKLTFAKAEHLKRNATAAADPKAVFQAMKPVFNDLLMELQRSISYFSNLYRTDKIGRIVALGNAMKLPGLRRYLSQNLGYEIEKIESYRNLTGSQVITAPTFQENLLSFGACYGLTLQGLGKGGVYTNLLPKEIIKDRLINRKKPWVVAAVAAVLLGFSVSFLWHSMAMGDVDVAKWESESRLAGQFKAKANRLKSEDERERNDFKATDQIGQHLVGNVEGRIRWLELLRAINSSLPSDPSPDEKDSKTPPIAERNELHITNIDCQQVEEVATWYAGAKKWLQSAVADSGAAGSPSGNATPEAEGPKGPGWIVRVYGYHYYNAALNRQGAQYVRETLVKNLRNGKVELPAGDRGGTETVTMQELGIHSPVLINPSLVRDEEVTDPNNNVVKLRRFDFDVQFCWQPQTPGERHAAQEAKKKDGSASP